MPTGDFRRPRIGGMRIVTAACCATVLLSMSTGCGLSRILRADFNEYAGQPADDLLNGSIPGIPSGDTIQNAQGASIVVDDPLEGKSLRVSGQVEFVPNDHETPDEYMIDWEGFRSFLGLTGNSFVSFEDNDGDEALVLLFNGEDGDLELMTGTEFVPQLDLGNFPHTIEITIDMGGVGRIDFSFQESIDDQPHPLNNLDFLDADFDELDRIRVEGSSSGPYYISDLDVFTRTRQN